MALVPTAVAHGILGLVVLFVFNMIRQGRLSRNRAVGIRTKHSLLSDESWQICHDKAAPYFTRAGYRALSFTAVLAVVGYVGVPSRWVGFLAVAPTLIVGCIYCVGAVVGNEAAQAFNRAEQQHKLKD